MSERASLCADVLAKARLIGLVLRDKPVLANCQLSSATVIRERPHGWRRRLRRSGWISGRCSACGAQRPSDQGPDPCLGYLPGVSAACCGHGNRDASYVMFEGGTRTIRGFDAIEDNR